LTNLKENPLKKTINFNIMRKIFISFLGIIMLFSCSTNNPVDAPETVPLAPTALTGSLTTNSQITLNWTDNSTNEAGFKIERKVGSGNYLQIASVNSDITGYLDNGLSLSTSYSYRVLAFNSVGSSSTYSNEFSITTNPPAAVLSNITIGTQVWQSSNYDGTTYRDGTPIPQVTDPTVWASLTTGAWCYFNNNASNGAIYGKLYNWYALAGIFDVASLTNQSLRKKFSPNGWHVPSDAEWTTLTTFLGGESVAGGKMKSTGTSYWTSPNLGATNSSGFTGLPGGRNDGGFFANDRTNGNWWSSSEFDPAFTWSRNLDYNNTVVTSYRSNKKEGFSVRLVKD